MIGTGGRTWEQERPWQPADPTPESTPDEMGATPPAAVIPVPAPVKQDYRQCLTRRRQANEARSRLS